MSLWEDALDDRVAAARSWPGHTGNWGRWPNNRGALNLITAEATQRGLAASRTGEVVPCARPLTLHDPLYDKPQATHEMDYVRVLDPEGRCQSAGDRIGFRVHGLVNTHIDAFSHCGFDGRCFNGAPFKDVIDEKTGANAMDITDMTRIVTRGVFVDVARARGIKGIEPGDSVKPHEIAEAVKRIAPGDAIVIRTGVTLTGGRRPGRRPDGEMEAHGSIGGLHAECIDMIGRADAAVVASDSGSDAYPSPVPECESPVHRLALVYWGMPLVHNMGLEELGEACAAQKRNDFLFVVSALNVPRATGSLCTPLAIL
jgi:kynurenine formamidase